MKNKLYYSVGLLAIGLVFMPAVVMGATATTTINVQANVIAACSVSASNINFRDIPIVEGMINNATGNVSVTCPNSVNYTIDLGEGQNPPGRRMRNASGSGFIYYELFKDINHRDVWRDRLQSLPDTGNGSAQSHTVFGRVISSADSLLDTYTDVISVTVTY